jgi:hypothetical protein
MAKEAIKKGKEVATNENGLGIEFVLKKSKAQSGELEMVVHVNKMACP